MAQLTNIISTGACYPRVDQVVVAIGTNGCAGNMPCDIAADYQKLLSAIKAHIPIAQQRTREPLCQQQVPLHAPDLHALAVLSARDSRPWHPNGQSLSPREGPGVA